MNKQDFKKAYTIGYEDKMKELDYDPMFRWDREYMKLEEDIISELANEIELFIANPYNLSYAEYSRIKQAIRFSFIKHGIL